MLSEMRRGSVSVETLVLLISASWGVVLVVRGDVYRFVFLEIGCRGDNIECMNDSWDLRECQR